MTDHTAGSALTHAAIGAARRVVVKVGSSSLTTADGGIDPARVARLVETLTAVKQSGREVVLVSSGAIAAGLSPLGLTSRPRDLASQQAAASVGQGLLMAGYTELFARAGIRVGQVLLTVDDVTRRSNYRNAFSTFGKLLELGVVPIVNENDTVATHEIRFGDNDRLAALVSHLVHADALILLSDVDALYTDRPGRPGARRLEHVHPETDLGAIIAAGSGTPLGTGGMATKLEAARIATSAGIPVVLTDAEHARHALLGLSDPPGPDGAPVGTLFHPTGKRRPTRLLWLAHASDTHGDLWLDAGAVRAVTERKASLLPAGITRVDGSFGSGDPVNLRAPDGSVVARGLANYDAAELPQVIGRTTAQLVEQLGQGYDRAVVHRDVLIVLDR
jgi:glutamate 5-kinase